MQKIVAKFDVVNVVREMSREQFRAMPKQQRINDKRRKQPRYKQDWRRNDD